MDNSLKKRHYCHGDQMAENTNLFFCARCGKGDFPPAHFTNPNIHGNTGDIISHINRYQSDLQEWEAETSFDECVGSDGITYFRPSNVVNLIKHGLKVIKCGKFWEVGQ